MERAHLDTLLAVLTNIPTYTIRDLVEIGTLSDVAQFVDAANALAEETGNPPEFAVDDYED